MARSKKTTAPTKAEGEPNGPDASELSSAPATEELEVSANAAAETPTEVDDPKATREEGTAELDEKPNAFTREFILPSSAFYGTDEELDTYKAGVIREAHLLGLRPLSVEVKTNKRNTTDGTTHLVLVAT